MRTSYRPTTALLATAAFLVVAPAAAVAQTAVQSPVPKDPCCFSNVRFAGTCQVEPRQGQLCKDILGYLNSFDSTGEIYCRSTVIRGGWAQVDCDTGAPAAPVGTTEKQLLDPAGEPQQLDVVTPSEADLLTTTTQAPRTLDPGELALSPADVL